MEQQNVYLDLTILSAADLSRNWLSGDQTVAVAWVESSSKKSTSVASGGGSNVQWQEKLTLPLNGGDALAQGKRLTIEIHSRGRWGNSLIGTVYVPVADLAIDGTKGAHAILTYQLVQSSGKRHGSLSFMAKIVKPIVSGSAAPLPTAPPLAENCIASGFNTSYPPSGTMYPSVEIDNQGASLSYSPYAVSETSPYPPQSHPSQNHTPEREPWQHVVSPYPSYGMGSHPTQVYPPVNTISPPYTTYSGITTYPPPAQQAPYPPPTSIYPPPPFSEPLYPPTSSYGSIASHSSEAPYPPTSLYPYPAYPNPSFYPTPYPPQQAPVHCCSPYPTYCGAAY